MHCERKENRFQELKVTVNAGLEGLKVICLRKDGYIKRVPIFRSLVDKLVRK